MIAQLNARTVFQTEHDFVGGQLAPERLTLPPAAEWPRKLEWLVPLHLGTRPFSESMVDSHRTRTAA
jgi:hypothetical protein